MTVDELAGTELTALLSSQLHRNVVTLADACGPTPAAVLAGMAAAALFRFSRNESMHVEFDGGAAVVELTDSTPFAHVLNQLRDGAARDGSAGALVRLRVDGRAVVITAPELPVAAEWESALSCLAEHAAADPAQRIGALRMLSDEQAAAQILTINAGASGEPALSSPEILFARLAAEEPDRIALITDDDTVSYGTLHARVEAFARLLTARGAGPERPLAVNLDRSVGSVVAVLAALRCGAPFVPLDRRMPVQRMRAIVAAADAVLVVGGEESGEPFDLGVPVVTEQDDFASAPATPLAEPHPGNAAYIYFTSGSTGTPKGVVTDRHCAAVRVSWTAQRYGLGPGTTVLHKTPLIFDVAIIEMLAPLSVGGAIRIAAPRSEADVAYLADVLANDGVTFVHFVPSMLAVFVNGVGGQRFPTLRLAMCTGEAVPVHIADRARQVFPEAEFHNLYGQTETSEITCWEGGGLSRGGNVPIGTQVGCYRLFVLDLALRPVPTGVPGEIHVAGTGGLARGYHGRADLTSERFVANPFPITAGERLYRTGDLGVRGRDGEIVFLNRADDQTKIGGARVEPAEVEAVVSAFPAVSRCAVVVRKDNTGANELVAYVVGTSSASRELRAWVADRLPTFQCPSAFVWLTELPFTDSGKLDRSALPAPADRDRLILADDDNEVCSPVEAELCAMWADTLGVAEVRPGDDFFSLNGNSLKAATLLGQITVRFNTRLSLEDLYGNPDVRSLARLLERSREGQAAGVEQR